MSNALDLHNYVIANRMLLPSLVGKNAGKVVHIIGNGPSAHRARFSTWPGDVIIFLNGAIKLYDNEKHGALYSYWLTCESKCWSAPWFRECPPDFGGTVIMEHDCIGFMLGPEVCGGDETADPFDFYDEAWWKRGIYVNRTQWETSERDIRRPGANTALSYGTYSAMENGEQQTRNAGTVLWQAIHLAGILGASEVHTYGTELMWYTGGDQHADGWRPYDEELAAKAGELALVRFDCRRKDVVWHGTMDKGYWEIPDHKIYIEPYGPFETQQMFLDSAYVLPAFMQECETQGMKCVNHSGGLLDLELGL